MAEFNENELIEYVTGQTDRAKAKQIEAAACRDPELAAQLDLMMGVAGMSLGDDPRPRTGPSAGMLVLASALCAVVLGGGVWAWHSYLRSSPGNLACPSTSEWTVGRPIVQFDEEFATLINRGYLVSSREHEAPYAIEFEWRWIDYGREPLYWDLLTVMLRTSAVPNEKNFYRPVDGLVVTLSPYGDSVTMSDANKDHGRPLQDEEQQIALKLPPDVWHKVRITDDGDRITAYVWNPILKHHPDQPVTTARTQERGLKSYIAIFNREASNGVQHESHIRNLRISALPLASP